VNRRSYWDRQAHNWGEGYGSDVYEKLRDLVDSLDLRAGDLVMDLGCGTGILFPYLVERVGNGGTILAIDWSAEMVRRAKHNHLPAGGSASGAELFLAAGEAERLPAKAGTFDVVTCFAAFAHFEDKETSAYEMGRLLKPGGRTYIIHLLGREQLGEHHREVGGPVAEDVLPEEPEMRRMLRQAGFSSIEITDSPSLYLARAEKVDNRQST
jgi:SAM-dependent methyltransferase